MQGTEWTGPNLLYVSFAPLNNFHLQRMCIISITIMFFTQDWDKSLIPKSCIPFPGWTLNIFVLG